MEEKSRHKKFGKLFKEYRNQIRFLGIITIAALLISFASVWGIRSELESSTREYCEEITRQMRNIIEFGINEKRLELVNVADSLSQTFDSGDMSKMEEFLKRKADILEFDALCLIDSQGDCIAYTMKEGLALGVQKVEDIFHDTSLFQNEVQTGFIEGQTLFYSAPVYTTGGRTYLLVGSRSKETMQSFIASDAFDGHTLSCIVDADGEVVLSPTDLKPFSQLQSIFENDGRENTSKELKQIREDMTEGKAGIVQFSDVYGQDNLLAYNPLEINDWFLMTIVPIDIMTGTLFVYFMVTFFIVLGISFMFMALLMLIYRTNRANQRHLARLAYEDNITGGMNGAAFQARFGQEEQETRRIPFAIVLLNVRRFKLINDKLGFREGNEILRLIYQGIESELAETRGEFAARSEMDNFFICLDEGEREQICARIAAIEHAVNQRLSRRYPGNRLSFTAGCSIATGEESDIRVLQDRARLAEEDEMAAPWDGCAFYSRETAERLKREQALEDMFDKSLESREFVVYLQPKVNIKTGKLRGAEALVRWNHPTMGMIPPIDFIPLLERNGKICQLDFYVFEEVCRFYRQRREQGKPWYPVSVNLSRYHFYEEGFLDRFYELYREYDMPARALEFELTESMFLDERYQEYMKKEIDQMHRMGFLCSLDDFGSGYSSLGVLKEFDVDTLKMDRSFFLDMDSQKAQDIIRSVVELAAKLQMETVAEGIEQKEQMDFLHEIQCDIVQGYFFSQPLPMDEFEGWVSQYETEQGPDCSDR